MCANKRKKKERTKPKLDSNAFQLRVEFFIMNMEPLEDEISNKFFFPLK